MFEIRPPTTSRKVIADPVPPSMRVQRPRSFCEKPQERLTRPGADVSAATPCLSTRHAALRDPMSLTRCCTTFTSAWRAPDNCPISPRAAAHPGMSAAYLRELVTSWPPSSTGRCARRGSTRTRNSSRMSATRPLHFVHRRAERADAPTRLPDHARLASPVQYLQLDFADLLTDFHVVGATRSSELRVLPYGLRRRTHHRGAPRGHDARPDDRCAGVTTAIITYGEDVSRRST